MKNSILSISIFVITIISSLQLTAQEFKSLDKSPMDVAVFPSSYKISDKIVKVTSVSYTHLTLPTTRCV